MCCICRDGDVVSVSSTGCRSSKRFWQEVTALPRIRLTDDRLLAKSRRSNRVDVYHR